MSFKVLFTDWLAAVLPLFTECNIFWHEEKYARKCDTKCNSAAGCGVAKYIQKAANIFKKISQQSIHKTNKKLPIHKNVIEKSQSHQQCNYHYTNINHGLVDLVWHSFSADKFNEIDNNMSSVQQRNWKNIYKPQAH